jgi:hypothetical protein
VKLKDLYRKAVEISMANDPRGRELLDRELEARRKDFEKLKDEDKEFFDQESLKSPYSDSRILYGTGDEEIKGAIVGIDMEGPEVLLTHALREKGEPIDLVIAHHPEGRPYATLYDVMGMQADILGRMGVPISVAEDLMAKRISEVERRLMPANHTRAVDTARLLNIPFMCMHTLADNMVATFLQKRFDEEKPYRVSDIMDMLNSIPEYQEGRRQGAGPKVLIGSDKRTAGKVFVDMTGGTGGSKDIYESLATSGITTVVGMHIGEDHRKEAEKHHVNVVIAGHISSDTLGINLMLDELSKTEPLKIYECSGFKRISRL